MSRILIKRQLISRLTIFLVHNVVTQLENVELVEITAAMKLVISGGSGFVATELIKQSLQLPSVTKLVVLSRKPISTPQGIDTVKLKTVLLEDYENYPVEARDEMAGANAFIW